MEEIRNKPPTASYGFTKLARSSYSLIMLINNEKQKVIYTHYARLSLTARPLDLLYFLFFAASILSFRDFD